MQVKKLLTTLSVSLLFSSLGFGGEGSSTPSILKFQEGEQFKIALSRVDFNRIYVEGEKIVELSFPEGSFMVDKSEQESDELDDGSVLIKPVFDLPLTAFFVTDKGHHFSLKVHASDESASTLRLLSKVTPKLNFIKKNTDDVVLVEDALSAMKAGESPKNFSTVAVIPSPFYVKKDIKVMLEKQYKGSLLSGYVYRLENKSKHEIALTTNLFSHKKAEMLSLSDEKLKPNQVAYLYGLYRNEG